jgi:hypothetical protein
MYMQSKYLKAIKAGLICAALIIIIRIVSYLVSYWAMSKTSVQEWALNQSANPTPYSTAMPSLPPDVLLAGIAICGGGLLIFALYVFAGILAAWYAAKEASGAVDLLILGAIAGAVAQAVSVPFQLGTILIANMFSAGSSSLLADIGPWLLSALITDLVVYVLVAAVLAAVSALISGALIKAFGQKNKV